MSGLMDKAKDAMSSKGGSGGQAGSGMERSADNAVNSKVDSAAGQAGIPQQANDKINKVVDGKVNSQIPGGN